MKNATRPSAVGARVVGGTIGLVLALATLIFVMLVPVILLATYYYSYDLVKFLQDNKKCQGCIKGEYHCDKVLRHTPIPLMVLLILNIVLSVLRINVHPGVKNVVRLVSFVAYVWFISCLYSNMTNLTDVNCACAAERKLTIDRLRVVSLVLLVLLGVSIAFSVIGMITIALGFQV
jgi:Ca2+/Na+ antiporter